jgi:hypothetical protein
MQKTKNLHIDILPWCRIFGWYVANVDHYQQNQYNGFFSVPSKMDFVLSPQVAHSRKLRFWIPDTTLDKRRIPLELVNLCKDYVSEFLTHLCIKEGYHWNWLTQLGIHSRCPKSPRRDVFGKRWNMMCLEKDVFGKRCHRECQVPKPKIP